MEIAIIDTWPGVKNAEYEVIVKLQEAFKKLGHNVVLVNNHGHILQGINRTVDEFNVVIDDQIDFALSLHYESYKIIDVFTFFTLWNPPDFTLNIPDDKIYSSVKANILSCDDYLGYNSKPMKNYIQNMTHSYNKVTEQMLQFVPSMDSSMNMKVVLDNPRLFYCGINWEKCTSKHGRHHNLFKALDELNVLEVYGPEVFHGMKPWDGYKSYKGDIAFDGGKTMIKKINDCGVSLVLSSDAHRNAEAATNRLYESLVGGAIIISDNNEFVKREFGDNILYIEYTHNSEFMKDQILDHLNWIKANKQHAISMAIAAQEIFTQKFCLNKQVKLLCAEYIRRKELVCSACHPSSQKNIVDVIVLYDELELSKQEVDHLIVNITKQIYKHFHLIIVCNISNEQGLNRLLSKHKKLNYTVMPTKLFNVDKVRIVGWGQAYIIARARFKGDYVAFMGVGHLWFKDHITKLYKILDDSELMIAYSSAFTYGRNSDGNVMSRNQIPTVISSDCFSSHPISTFLVRRDYINQFPDYTLNFLDHALPNLLLCTLKDRANNILCSPYKTCGVRQLDNIKHSEIKIIKDFFPMRVFPTKQKEYDVLERLKREIKSKLSADSKLYIILRFFYLRARRFV
jgi:hypothetical protein